MRWDRVSARRKLNKADASITDKVLDSPTGARSKRRGQAGRIKKTPRSPVQRARQRQSRKAAAASFSSATAKAILSRSAQGLSAEAIAGQLGIQVDVVRRHIDSAPLPSKKQGVVRIALGSSAARQGSARSKRRRKPKPSKRGATGFGIGGALSKQPKSRRKKPQQGLTFAEIERAKRARLEREMGAAERRLPVPEGTSRLEILVASGELEHALKETNRLATEKDDPFAWRDLALGYRSKQIQRPVEDAIRRVGAERVLRKIEHNPSPDWPEDLIAFLDAEIAGGRPKKILKREALPHEQSGFNRPRGFDD